MFKCPHCDKPIKDQTIIIWSSSIRGKKVAKERGPDFYRKLQAKRKHRKGGRPRKKS